MAESEFIECTTNWEVTHQHSFIKRIGMHVSKIFNLIQKIKNNCIKWIKAKSNHLLFVFNTISELKVIYRREKDKPPKLAWKLDQLIDKILREEMVNLPKHSCNCAINSPSFKQDMMNITVQDILLKLLNGESKDCCELGMWRKSNFHKIFLVAPIFPEVILTRF